MGETREKRQSKHNKTQIASLLAVATILFISLWTLFKGGEQVAKVGGEGGGSDI